MSSNTKFTFNKKSFALSLACVSFLATAGYAEVQVNGSTVTSGVFNTSAQLGLLSGGATVSVTEATDSIGFSSGGSIVKVGSGAVVSINANGITSFKGLNLFNASGDNTLGIMASGAALNIHAEKVAIGSTANGTVLLAGGVDITKGANEITIQNVTLSGGSITTQGEIGNITIGSSMVFSSGANTIENKGNITGDFTISGMFGSGGDAIKSGEKIEIKNTGTINAFTIANGAGFVEGSTKGSGAFSIINSGSIITFTNNGTLQGNTKAAVSINSSGTINNFTNSGSGVIKDATISNTGTIGTFENFGTITGGTLTAGSITGTFNNAGTINATKVTATIGGTFTNAGTIIGLKDSSVTLSKDATTFTNSGLISGAGAGGTANAFKVTLTGAENERKATITFTNEATGNLTGVSGAISGVIKEFNNKGEIKDSYISNTGTIVNFSNTGTIGGTFSGGTIANFDNSGVINGAAKASVTTTFKNGVVAESATDAKTSTLSGAAITLVGKAERSAVLEAQNGSKGVIKNGTIIASDFIKSFTNAGTIDGTTFSGAAATNGIIKFTNDNVLKDAKFKSITVGEFVNNKEVTGFSGDGFTIKTGFENAENATFAFNNTKTHTITMSKGDNTYFKNAGIIEGSGGRISIAAGKLGLFENTGTFEKAIISGASTTSAITNFTNSGLFEGTLSNLTIDSFTNSKTADSNTADITTAGTAGINIGTLRNEATLNIKGGTINVTTGLVNASESTIEIGTAAAGATINLSGAATAAKAKLAFNNQGTIYNGGTAGVITVNDQIKSFTNSGTIDSVNVSGAATIETFLNSGTITNAKLDFDATNFKNSGDLVLTAGSEINLVGSSARFENSKSIENLGTLGVNDTKTADIINSGTIINGLVSIGASVGEVNFNNSGLIQIDGASNVITGATGTTAKLNISNTGRIELNGATGAHIDPANFGTAAITINRWHLEGIGKAAAFNDQIAPTFTSASKTDRIVLGSTANLGALKFGAGAIIIDPTKNNLEAGKSYRLDQIVVDANGTAVEKLDKALATKIKTAEGKGEADPRLVTIGNLASADPVVVIQGVDAYNNLEYTTDNAVVGEATTEDRKVYGTGETIKAAEGSVVAGDGIIDSFGIGVDATKSIGAIATQGAVSNSMTRSAFVGTVVTTAVNAALNSINVRNISSNDVDTSKLEKYAQVTGDVANETYGAPAKSGEVFVMPYYRSTSVDLTAGDSLDGDTFGILGGVQKNLGDAGVLGFFLGYETTSADSNAVDSDDDTFYGGVNYYKAFAGSATMDYFAKGMLRAAFTSSDVTPKNGLGQQSTSPDSSSYGLELGAGVNFYNGIHTFTPEIAFSYDRVSVDGALTTASKGEDANINLVVTKVGATWLANWTESFNTTAGLGIRYNFNDNYDANVGILQQDGTYRYYNGTVELGDFYYYVTLGANVALTRDWSVGLTYNGDFSSDATSHGGFLKVGYSW